MSLRIDGEVLAFARDRGGRQPYEAAAHSQSVSQLGGAALVSGGQQQETAPEENASVADQIRARGDMEAGLRQMGLF